ncbi:MAG TPA: PEGA domain-containing protein [Kofleriaceae bacterium]
MLARRIIAVSPDKGFGKQLATALKAAGGTVDLHASIAELGTSEVQAALVVLHLEGESASAAAELLPRLSGDARVICILPRSNLAAVVDTMQASDRVAGLLTTEQFESRELSAMATRVLSGDIFGLEKMIQWGTQIHNQLVGDYQEKSLAISQVSEFAELMGVRRKYRESIEQCIDEMLMNALYDAPVDENGQPLFSEIPTKTRISLRVEQKVVVQYACDGKRFAVSVRDAFGTLERATVLRYLHKCLHAEQQIDRKVGGAGLGLYLMVNSASAVIFNVLPGVATEVVCVFDLEMPKMQLEEIGFFHEKIDAAGRLATGPSKRLPGTASFPVERRASTGHSGPSPLLVRVLAGAIFAMCVLIGFVAWPRLMGGKKLTQVTFVTEPKGAQIELEGHSVGSTADGSLAVRDLEVGHNYAVVVKAEGYLAKQQVVQPRAGGSTVTITLEATAAVIDVDSSPTGATVSLDGKDLGQTPLQLSSLPPNSSATLTFKKTGYQDVAAKLEVPAPGKEVRISQPLTVASAFARVKLTSEPSGASITQNGQLLVGVTTPAEILVEANKPTRFVISMPKKVPVVIDAFTPGPGADGIAKNVKLIDGVALHVEASLDGRFSVRNVPSCQDVSLPGDCLLGKGTFTLELTGPSNAHVIRKVTIAEKDVSERFEFGFVDAGQGKQIVVGPGVMAKRVALEAGPHTVTIADEAGTHTAAVKVKAGATVTAN